MSDRKPIRDEDHQPLRIAVMKQDLEAIREIVEKDYRLLSAFEDLALTIARYHHKTESIQLLIRSKKKKTNKGFKSIPKHCPDFGAKPIESNDLKPDSSREAYIACGRCKTTGDGPNYEISWFSRDAVLKKVEKREISKEDREKYFIKKNN